MRRIVLIDGLFHGVPAVWQREIVAAMDDGIEVLGASSMGALRAAELAHYGMVGHGTIFGWYRDGVIDGDDEVALLHGDAADGFLPLSEPLVNLRATLARAVDAEVVSRVCRAMGGARSLDRCSADSPGGVSPDWSSDSAGRLSSDCARTADAISRPEPTIR